MQRETLSGVYRFLNLRVASICYCVILYCYVYRSLRCNNTGNVHSSFLPALVNSYVR